MFQTDPTLYRAIDGRYLVLAAILRLTAAGERIEFPIAAGRKLLTIARERSLDLSWDVTGEGTVGLVHCPAAQAVGHAAL